MLLQVGEGKKKKKDCMCIIFIRKKILSLGMHQYVYTSKYRELFGTMLTLFRYLLLCVHGAVGCDVIACRGKLKFQLLSRFFFLVYSLIFL